MRGQVRGRHRGLPVIVPGGVARVRAAQPPGVLVPAQEAGFAPALPPDAPVRHADVHPAAPPPLHLPVAGPAELALAAGAPGPRCRNAGGGARRAGAPPRTAGPGGPRRAAGWVCAVSASRERRQASGGRGEGEGGHHH